MRISMNAHAEELGIPSTGHPLSDHYISVFVWRYEPSPQYPQPEAGATLTVQSTRRRRRGEGRALSITDAPFPSVQCLQSTCEALHAADGNSLFEAIKAFLPPPPKPKPKARKARPSPPKTPPTP